MSGMLVTPGGIPSLAVRVLAVALFTSLPSAAHAGRVGSIEIRVDGKTWLTGSTFDNGSPPPAAVWRELATRELRPADGVTVPPDQADPLRAMLRGKIAVDVQYGGKAEVKELRLVRTTPRAGWTVDPEDVERIAKEIGLGEVPAVVPEPRAASPEPGRSGVPAAGDFPWLWVAGGGTAVLAAVIIWVIRARRAGSAGRAEPGAAPDRGRM